MLLADAYTSAGAIEGGPFHAVTVEVFGADVFVAFRPVAADRIDQEYGEELFLPRGAHSFERRCDGVRVRNAVPGIQARVTFAAYERADRT